MWVLLLLLSFGLYLHGISFSSPSLSVCMCLLFQGGSLVDSIYRGLAFVFIQPVFVFWLGQSTHLHLRWLLISMIPLPFILLFWVWVYTLFLCFLSREDHLAFVQAGLVVLNSLSFCLSVKLLSSPSYLNEILAGYSNLGCRLFSFITLSMSCHSLLAWRVSLERSAVILMGIPLCVIRCFSLAAFNICSLRLIFVNLTNMCLGVFHLGSILFGTLWVSWTWVIISFPILGKFSTIISSSIFSWFSF